MPLPPLPTVRAKKWPNQAARWLLVALTGAGIAGCASGGGDDAVPIALGLPLGDVLDSLEDDGAPGTRVRVEETRLLRVDAQPYAPLDRGAAEAAAFPVAVLVGRTCRFREGLSVTERERASWFLFEGGVLRAADHDVFGERCEVSLFYVPAAADRAGLERSLTRFATQRYPDDLDDLDGRADRAEAWVGVGRFDEARSVVDVLDRRIASLRDRLRKAEEYEDADLVAYQQEHDRLRGRRAGLVRALRDAGVTAY